MISRSSGKNATAASITEKHVGLVRRGSTFELEEVHGVNSLQDGVAV